MKMSKEQHAWLQLPDRPTMLDLEKIVERCLRESLEAGRFLSNSQYTNEIDQAAFHKSLEQSIDFMVVSQHIAKSVIGELYEFEIIRKLAPIFRMIPQLKGDFEYIDDRFKQEEKLRSLRKEPT